MGRSYQIGIIATAVGVALVVFMIVPVFSGPGVSGVQMRNMSNAKQLALACKIYTQDHDGRFPLHLSELAPDYVQQADLEKLRCTSLGLKGEPTYEMDWLYFGAGFDEKNPPRLLIASPQATTTSQKQKRAISEGDASARIVNEATYIPLLNETIQQMQNLHPARPVPTNSTTETATPN